MNKTEIKKLTLSEIIAKKEQILEAKTKGKKISVFVESLGGAIVVEKPDKSLIAESVEMDNGDEYLLYQCCVEPCLKDTNLHKEFGCVEPMEIVAKLFEPGEVTAIAKKLLGLAGYGENSTKVIEEIKN